jgi:hypothetical protein
MKSRLLPVILTLTAFAAFGQYKLEPAGPPPPEVAPAIAAALQTQGHRVLTSDGKVYCEIWFRKEAPKGPVSSEVDLMWKTVPPGSLIGAIKYHTQGHDRRGQDLKPGVYTLRFSMFPINGDHQGVAPNRDFLVLAPADADKSLEPVSNFDALINMSRKVSGRQHPAVLSMWLVESDFKPGLQQTGEDWTIQTKVGDAQVGLIVIGKAEG